MTTYKIAQAAPDMFVITDAAGTLADVSGWYPTEQDAQERIDEIMDDGLAWEADLDQGSQDLLR